MNAGICWAHAILIRFDETENSEDFVSIGAISFALTVVNIVCIWVSGILMFAVKVRKDGNCLKSAYLTATNLLSFSYCL